MGLPHLCLAKNNDREKRPQPRAPRPKGRFARRVPLKSNESRFPFGRGARRLGLAFAIYNGSTIPLSAPRGLCENHPNLGAELPLPLGAGALGRALRFSNARDWDSHSRARFGRALLLPKSCPSLCHRARVAVCGVFVCRRCVLRVSNGLPARSGATRSAYAAQNRARRFSTKQACRKLHPCQSIASRLAIARGIFARFSASGGRRPLNWDIAPAGRGGLRPRWWCCEGRRCRGSLTQLATIRFSLLPRRGSFAADGHRTTALPVICRGQVA